MTRCCVRTRSKAQEAPSPARYSTPATAEKIYVGTDDTGATDSDPTGGGASGNNMVLVTDNEYDSAGRRRQQPHPGNAPVDSNSANDRVTGYGFDWRNRQSRSMARSTSTANTFDNLGRVDSSGSEEHHVRRQPDRAEATPSSTTAAGSTSPSVTPSIPAPGAWAIA